MNKEIALQNLIDIRDAFDELKMDYFLAYGTCLGAVREGDFISYDPDIDIGIMNEKFDFKLINNLVRKGFELKYVFGMRHVGFEIAMTRGGVKTDFMIYYKKDDKVWTGLWRNGGRNGMDDIIKTVYDAKLFEGRKTIQLSGVDFKTLEKAEEYLDAHYGYDWRIPTNKWDWKSSSPSIRKDFLI